MKPMRIARAAGATAILVFTTTPALAAFINNVDSFDGTVKDTATWAESTYAGSNIAQNDAMILNKGDYTTRSITVGIGQSVSARMTPVAPTTSGTAFDAYLLLTTDSGGAASATTTDSRFVGLAFDTSTTNTDVYGVDGASSAWDTSRFVGLSPQRGGQTFLAEVDRLSATSAHLSVRDAASNLLGEETFTFNPARGPVPSDLKISLFGIATYDDVTILPEPRGAAAAAAALAFAFTTTRARIRRRPSRGCSSMAER